MAGHSDIGPPTANENRFVADDDAADFGMLDVPHEITPGNIVVDFFLKTTRCVGEVDGLGFLEHGDAAARNGWLAPTMQLTIRYTITAEPGGVLGQDGVEVDLFLHRGIHGRERSLGKLSGDFGRGWQEFTCEVATVDVRFPDDPCPDQPSFETCDLSPEPRSNKVSFVFTGDARMTLEVDWMTLEPEDHADLAWQPVLLLHGHGGNASDMGPGTVWADGLASRDVGHYAVDLTSRGDVDSNGLEVATAVRDLKKRFGVQHVNIVGFDKGGIDARSYLRSNSDVAKLIMLASPNRGSFLVDACLAPLVIGLPWTALVNPWAFEMSTVAMDSFNSFTRLRLPTMGVAICATYDSAFAEAAGAVYGPNDEVVSTASVTALPGVLAVFHATSVTDEFSQGICATERLTNHNCLRHNVRIFTRDVDQLKPLRPPQPAADRSMPPLGLDTAVGSPVGSRSGSLEGLASDAAAVPTEGVVQAHSVLVDSVDTAQFSVFAQGDVLGLQLVSPSETRIDPSSPATDAGIVHAPLLDAGFFWCTAYQVQDPEPGIWTLEVKGTTAASSGDPYLVAVHAQPTPGLGISLTAGLDGTAHVVGDEVTITATVTSGSEPVTDATVTAQVLPPHEAGTTSVVLSADAVASNGRYRGTFIGTALPGPYPVVVTAQGSAPAFTRQQVLLVTVAPSATAFSGAVADHGVDTDGDGRYDQLVIDIELDVDVAAAYRVYGTLMDGAGTSIEQVCPVQPLEPGVQVVSLLFDGARLFDLGLDGPYVLDDLVIEDVATSTGLARGQAYTTAAYSHDEFTRPVCVLSGSAADRGANTDSGSQLPYEELVIELGVDTLVAAEVQAVGQLYAEDGTFITTGRTFSSLAAGPNVLEFHFPAGNIYRVGRAGPYTLQLFSMWESATEDTSVSLRAPGVVAVTQPYTLDDFAPAPVHTVGGTVTGLQGEGLELTDVVTFLSVRPGSGPFTFSRPRPAGSAYDVRVTAQPTNPLQVCSIANGTGTVGGSDVTDVAVVCVTTAPEAGLDPNFGSAGKVTAQHPAFDVEFGGHATAIALQSDGKIVLVRSRTLARYDTGGRSDPTFGTDGVADVVFGSSGNAAAETVAVQPDGKIVVAGYGTSDTQGTRIDFALARYTADGAPDPDFGGGRAVLADLAGGTDYGRSVLIQDDGRIVVAGLAVVGGLLGHTEFGVVRYTADGDLDPSFGSGGKVTTALAGGSGDAVAMALQPDGKIVVAGRLYRTSRELDDRAGFGLVRYTIDGVPDPDFGDGGVTRADFGLGVYATALAISSDGSRIVVAGGRGGTPDTFAVACFDASGSPDPDFGSGGLVTTPFESVDATAQAVAVQADGKVVVAGYTNDLSDFSNGDFALARYTADGEPDPAFGFDGKLTIDFFADSDRAHCLAIQPDGKIVVAGTASRGSLLAAIRLLP